MVIGVFVAAELYLATYHPFDVVVRGHVAVAVMVNAFRFFTPNEVFPVTYGGARRRTSTSAGAGARRSARRSRTSSGLTVLDIKPVGLEGSGGSTPLRLRVAGDPDTYLFGKLYAMSHVRADRWYKLGRTMLYGRLEDEAPFQSVRRLVEYEDYTLAAPARRRHRRPRRPTASSSSRPSASTCSSPSSSTARRRSATPTVDDDVIDQGLRLVRQLWDAGLAHRDIKPANLLVQRRSGAPHRRVLRAGAAVTVAAGRRPRQHDARPRRAHRRRRVYQRALQYFTPDEIAEAFAAARGIASPTQLRTAMKQDGRDLVAHFRELAPERRPISLQRWNAKRVVLSLVPSLVVVAGSAFTLAQTKSLLARRYDVERDRERQTAAPAT